MFQTLIALDFSSHYMHMYSSLVTGSRSHKTVTSDVSRVLSFYYNNSTNLFLICAGNELFFVALYLMKWVHDPLSSLGLQPTYLTSFTWPEAMALSCFPICLLKNVINLVQLWKAAKILVGVDLAERAQTREEDAQRGK